MLTEYQFCFSTDTIKCQACNLLLDIDCNVDIFASDTTGDGVWDINEVEALLNVEVSVMLYSHMQ